MSPSFLDIFTYRLLKAVFNTHPYGRTILSLAIAPRLMKREAAAKAEMDKTADA